ncbi:NRDE family protein [Teredinibacter sp. KSP-S5-2]|uniref:NRDE family protein n=1 Tax=Teredinibacter sp. KSP-S5-2 TaxID=3034506 RepID=UPI0029351B3E|nr:NRDE family protein [Teredinibacter sp. KSP-S5-2]WNO10111.1 NRDE family protein [Teredinibacter sp. KSP-S5-2]
MCTISWQYSSNGYSLFFNRDEQKTRLKAIPPQHLTVDGISYIAPIDPEGKGTWVAVNEYGFGFALLNFYQGHFPKGTLFSRGQIVNGLAGKKNWADIENFFTNLRLQRYAPFSLLVFIPPTLAIKDKVEMIRWNGRELLYLSQSSPLISSAFKFEEVYTSRMNCYWDLCRHGKPITNEQLVAFHAGHKPAKSAYSVCMHREDAETVSFTRVNVSEHEVELNYHDGSPCHTTCTHSLKLKRVNKRF